MSWPMQTGPWGAGMPPMSAGPPMMTPDMANMANCPPEQWAMMQQQNWQQWAQWQQQYSQWQTQYGEKYAQQVQQYGGAPPPPPTAPPPAPPPPEKPPPPPHENNQPLFETKPPPPKPEPVPPPNVTPKSNLPGINQQTTQVNVEALKKLAEEQKQFDLQFEKWEEEIGKWKKENDNHPDKQAYQEYVEKFAAIRAQLLERRKQMNLRRAKLLGNCNPADASSDALSNTSNQQNAQPVHDNQSKEYNKSMPQNSMAPQDMYGSYQNTQQEFLTSSSSSKGIPGLDLVAEEKPKANDAEVIDITDEAEVQAAPDYSKISKGISSLLEDDKILNILSMVRGQNTQGPTNQAPYGSFQDNRGQPTWNQNNYNQVNNENSNQSYGNMQNERNQYMQKGNSNSQSDRNQTMHEQEGYSNHQYERTQPPMQGYSNQQGIPSLMQQNVPCPMNQGLQPFRPQGPPHFRQQGPPPFRPQAPPPQGQGPNNSGHNMRPRLPHPPSMQNQVQQNQGQSYGGQQSNMQNRNNNGQNFGGQASNMNNTNYGDVSRNMQNQSQNYAVPPPNAQNQGFMGQQQNMRGHSAPQMQQRQFLLQNPSNVPPQFNNGQDGNNRMNMQYNEHPQLGNDNHQEFQKTNLQPANMPPQQQYNNMPPQPNQNASFPQNKPAPKWVEEPLFTPSIVVEYEHKPLRLKAREFIEPVHTFDYNHKSKDDEFKNVRKEREEDEEFYSRNSRRPNDELFERKDPDRYSRDNTRDYERRQPHRDETRPKYDDYDDRRRFDSGGRVEDRRRPLEGRREPNYDDRRRDDRHSRRDEHPSPRRSSERDRYRSEHRRESRFRSRTPEKESRRRPNENDENVNFVAKKAKDDKSDDKSSTQQEQKQNMIMIDDLLEPPGREVRPSKIVIILRGPPGSGKSYLAKLIRDKEAEHGGSARIMSIDDYFTQEVEIEEVDPSTGKTVKKSSIKYEYDEKLEETYINSLKRAFKRTVTDRYFSFLIYDAVNDQLRSYADIWNFARQNGFQAYICTMELDPNVCFKRNIHNRTLDDIQVICSRFFKTPAHHIQLDASTLLQGAAITDVDMEDVTEVIDLVDDSNEDEVRMEDNTLFYSTWEAILILRGKFSSPVLCGKWVANKFYSSFSNILTKALGADPSQVDTRFTSKWDQMEDATSLARLDGTSKPLRPSQFSMEDYLQLDDWTPNKAKPGKKTVRWADIEERREQEKMRAIGFVVGQTDWNRMTDPTMGSSALTQTKYIERVRRFKQ